MNALPHRPRSRPRAAGRVAVPAHRLPRPRRRRVRAPPDAEHRKAVTRCSSSPPSRWRTGWRPPPGTTPAHDQVDRTRRSALRPHRQPRRRLPVLEPAGGPPAGLRVHHERHDRRAAGSGEKWMEERLGLVDGPPARPPGRRPCLLRARPGIAGPRRVLRPQGLAVAAEDRPRRDQLHRGIPRSARRSAAGSSGTS